MNKLTTRGTIRPLSSAQMGIWIAQCLDPESPVFNIAEYVEIQGPLDVVRFDTALRQVVAQADALHIRIVETDQGPQQRIDPDFDWTMPFIDVSTSTDPCAAAEQWMAHDMERVVNLVQGPVFGFCLFRVSAARFFWYHRYHHIANDGFGGALIAQQLADAYSALGEDGGGAQEHQARSWFDILDDDDKYRRSTHFVRDHDFWLNQLEAFPAPATLCGRRPQRSRGFIRSTCYLPQADVVDLRLLCSRTGVSLPELLTATAVIYCQRITGVTDLAVGIPLTARFGTKMRSIVGMCTNVLPLRLKIDPHCRFEDLVNQVSRGMRQILRHQRYRAEDLRRDLGLRPNDLELFGPTINVMAFDYDLRFDGTPTRVHKLAIGPVNDLVIAIYDTKDGADVRIDFNANPDLYSEQILRAHQRRFIALLSQCAKVAPDLPVDRFDMLDESERRAFLELFKRTAAAYPRDRCIHQLFEEQVKKTPAATAVAFESETLSYDELNRRANQLARYLRRMKVGTGVAVGICLERSLQMMTGLLAILKTGASYVPLDPAFPPERLAFMLADSQCAVLLTQKSLLGLLPHENVQIACMDASEAVISQEQRENLQQNMAPEDLAYILYTSGSTGKPKGVEITHRALTNFLCSMRAEPGCTEQDVLLAVTTLSFDIAGLELFLPLIVGGRVDLVTRQVASDGLRLKKHIEQTRPSVMQATPATWRILIAAGWSGTPGMKALCGGEGLPRELANQLLDRTAGLWNMYGPTETTIWSSIHRVGPADPEITIGRPIANTCMYVLDRNLQPVPVGVAGELFIGGDGVARGYKNRPELTAERFLSNPFSEQHDARLYRTGDLARYREDGNIVHLGRMDDQVKLRGFRIELGEIEAALAGHDSVKQAVVMLRDDRADDQCLAAYVVTSPGPANRESQLRQHLRNTLPDYMIPQYIVEIDAFPLTPNGKIDRKMLPAPQRGARSGHSRCSTHPRNETERLLTRIFSDVLGMPQVGIHDNFFELGGHSLLAVKLMSSISSTFNVNLPLQILFDSPTVVGLSVSLTDTNPSPPIEDVSGKSLARNNEPRTSTERRLLAIWERHFPGLEIGIRDSFVALPGSGNLLDPMLAEVKQQFRVFAEGLPVITFLEEPTIEALARIIGSATEHTSALVVCMQPHGLKTPLFLIHAGGGYVFFYRALVSRMGKDRPIYTIRAETKQDGLGRPFDQSESIEELASRYISEIKTVQPVGPYCLGGACVGGVIAFEMVMQLQAQGEQIEGPVLVFDSFVMNNPRGREYQERCMNASGSNNLRRRLAAVLDQTSGLRIDRKFRHLSTKLRSAIIRKFRGIFARAAGVVVELRRKPLSMLERPLPINDEQIQQMQLSASFLQATERLLLNYKPGEYRGTIALWKATESMDPEPLWLDLAARGMVVYQMPGNHLDMMDEPAVAATARLVTGSLDGTTSGTRPANQCEPDRGLLTVCRHSVDAHDSTSPRRLGS